MISNHFYEDAKVLMYNSKHNGIKQSGGKQANLAHAISHITAVRSSKNLNYCSVLKKSLQKKSLLNDVPLKRIENLFHNITKKFNEKNHDAELEGEQIGKVLETSSDVLKFLMGNKKILKGLERLIKKEMKSNSGRPGSDNGFDNGFNNGFDNEFDNGFNNGFDDGFDNGFDDGFHNGFGPRPTGKPSTPWWASPTPPPFWNSSHSWNETWWQSTSNWNSSKPWWVSSSPPPFWNSTYNWNETFWQSTNNWNYTSTTTEPYNSSYFDDYTSTSTTTEPYNSSYSDDYGGGYDYSYEGTTNDGSYDYYGTEGPAYDYRGDGDGLEEDSYGYDYGDRDYYGDDDEAQRPPPPINVSSSAKELEDKLKSLKDNEVDDLLSSLDENTMWQIYEKLNGTDVGGKLEEKLFDSGYDEESEGWASVFGDTAGSFFRKKRQVGDFDKMDPKEMKNLASMGLQGLMMMDPEDFDLPKPLRHLRHEIPMCLKEILWEADGDSRLCAEIPGKLKGKLRNLMMMVLKQEISTNFFTLDWISVASSIENAKDEFEDIGKGVIKIVMVPIKVDDLKKLLESVKNLYKKVVLDNVKENGSKDILMLVVDLIDVLKDDDILEEVVALINRIQGFQYLDRDHILNTFCRNGCHQG